MAKKALDSNPAPVKETVGTKNLDAIVPRLEIAIGTENGSLVLVDQAGSKTVLIRGDEITQNGLELYARIEQEFKNLEKAHKAFKTALIEKVETTFKPGPVENDKGLRRWKGPYQEGRRLVEFTTNQEVDVEAFVAMLLKVDPQQFKDNALLDAPPECVLRSVDWPKYLSHKTGLDVATLEKKARNEAPDSLKTEGRKTLKVK